MRTAVSNVRFTQNQKISFAVAALFVFLGAAFYIYHTRYSQLQKSLQQEPLARSQNILTTIASLSTSEVKNRLQCILTCFQSNPDTSKAEDWLELIKLYQCRLAVLAFTARNQQDNLEEHLNILKLSIICSFLYENQCTVGRYEELISVSCSPQTINTRRIPILKRADNLKSFEFCWDRCIHQIRVEYRKKCTWIK